jgi:hypothetical protein
MKAEGLELKSSRVKQEPKDLVVEEEEDDDYKEDDEEVTLDMLRALSKSEKKVLLKRLKKLAKKMKKSKK